MGIRSRTIARVMAPSLILITVYASFHAGPRTPQTFKRAHAYIGTKGRERILMDHTNSRTYYPFTSSNETQLNQNSKHLTIGKATY